MNAQIMFLNSFSIKLFIR